MFAGQSGGTLPVLAVDQIYFRGLFAQWIAVKKDAYPLQPRYREKLYSVGQEGLLYHSATTDGRGIAFFFHGLSEEEARALLRSIALPVVKRSWDLLVSTAHAGQTEPPQKTAEQIKDSEDFRKFIDGATEYLRVSPPQNVQCPPTSPFISIRTKDANSNPLVDPALVTQLMKIAKRTALNTGLPDGDCFKSTLQGIWNGSFGGLLDTLKEMGEEGKSLLDYAIKHPDRSAMLAINPTAFWGGYLTPKVSALGENFRQIFEKFDEILPGIADYAKDPRNENAIVKILCQMSAQVGTELGIDLVLSLLVPGGATKLLAKSPRLLKMAESLKKLAGLGDLAELLKKDNRFGRIFESILQGKPITPKTETALRAADSLVGSGMKDLAGEIVSCAL